MRNRGTLAICCAVIAAGVAVAAPASLGAQPAQTYIDDFNGAAGSLPSSSVWSFDLGGGGWGNGELQTYTSSPSNIKLDGQGHLLITARRTVDSAGTPHYTSARISTRGKVSFPYGTVAARIALPRQKGLNPAFWMLGSDLPSVGYPACGEIDGLEAPDRSHSFFTVHGPTSAGTPWAIGSGISSSATDFHVYWIHHSAGAITLGIDSTTIGTLHKGDLAANERWVFDKGFDALLDMSVGGSFSGAPDSSTVFPSTMTVDWVRFTS